MKIYVRNRTTSKYITLEMVEIKGEVYRNMFILGENETVLLTSAGGRLEAISKRVNLLFIYSFLYKNLSRYPRSASIL